MAEQNQDSIDMTLTGNNVIRLNAATMERAVEYWLNNVVLRQPVTVVRVKERSNEGVFEVAVTEAGEE